MLIDPAIPTILPEAQRGTPAKAPCIIKHNKAYIFALRKKGSKMQKRTDEQEIEKGDYAPPVLPSARICPYFYGNSTCNPQYGNAVVDFANLKKSKPISKSFNLKQVQFQIDYLPCPGIDR